jgi:hypothetical protein
MNQNRNQPPGQVPQSSGPEFSRGIAGSGKSVETEGRHRSGEDETAFDERTGARREDLKGEAGPKNPRKKTKTGLQRDKSAAPSVGGSASMAHSRRPEDEDRASGAPDEDEAMRENGDERRGPRET